MSTSKHSIPLNSARLLTSTYRKNKKKVLRDEYHNKAVLPDCETFDREPFDKLLARTDCVGVRFYYGMDEEMNVRLVFVGVDENGADILPQPAPAGVTMMAASTTNDDPEVYEEGVRCPPACPTESTLNQD
jgi:hypothetical protein